ncbi:hypothetical protein VM57_10645 [Stenotrophomonas maltophilia]|uniref:Uncharacterized protein n=1 Tax=Stenotrophomonas maltophilia TaxID=40324 RepID=A0A0F5ZNL6_STEMA|nr:hypothetical protein VM57_10645 [Stenotrophomonas maltophilia]
MIHELKRAVSGHCANPVDTFASHLPKCTHNGVPMSHTGLFKIRDLTYTPGAEGDLARALQVEATCTACGATSVWGEQEWSMCEEEPCLRAGRAVRARPSAMRA